LKHLERAEALAHEEEAELAHEGKMEVQTAEYWKAVQVAAPMLGQPVLVREPGVERELQAAAVWDQD
jgi:hypothetical protein